MVRKVIRNFAAILLLIAAGFSIAAAPAGAAQNLVVTDYNKWYLQNCCTWVPYGNGELLKWIENGPWFSIRNSQYEKLKWIGSIPAVTTTDSYGSPKLWGECVSLVKLLSWSGVATTNWIRGDNVILSNVAPGTVIATFNIAPSPV